MLNQPYGLFSSSIGEFFSLKNKKDRRWPAIWFQKSNEASKYHMMPDSLKPYFDRAIKDNIDALLACALKHQKKNLEQAAYNALKDHKDLMVDAGLF